MMILSSDSDAKIGETYTHTRPVVFNSRTATVIEVMETPGGVTRV